MPRTDFASVKDYFDAFLLKEPQGEILDGNISIGDGWASDTGIYEVSRATYWCDTRWLVWTHCVFESSIVTHNRDTRRLILTPESCSPIS